MNHDEGVVVANTHRGEAPLHLRGGRRFLRHFDGVTTSIRWLGEAAPKRRQQVPLVFDRMPGSQLSRPRERLGIGPTAVGDAVPNPGGRAGRPGQPNCSEVRRENR